MSQLDNLRGIIGEEPFKTISNEYSNEDYDGEYYNQDDEDYESDDSEYSYQLSAQEQWEESMKQIEGLISFVIFPLIGKVLGRRTSHMIWRRIANWWFI